MSKKRCLVTGAGGFIGSHLCDRLLKDGHEVVGLDNLMVGRYENVKQNQNNPKFSFHVKDVSSLSKTPYMQFDWIFHLAALADIVPSINDPSSYHRANVDGTMHLLEFARGMKRPPRILYAASSSCYGIPDQYPTTEATPCRPKYPYALTKYVAEQYVMHWSKVYKIPAISLRLFNVYGPRARTSGSYGAVFGVFLAQLANGKPVTVVGDGTQKRDFTFVSDVVSAFVKAAESEISGEIFNIASSRPKSVGVLAHLLGAKEISSLPKRPGEPDITWGNISKANELLAWYPEVSFEEGVEIMKDLLPEFKDAPLWDKSSIADVTKDWFTYLS